MSPTGQPSCSTSCSLCKASMKVVILSEAAAEYSIPALSLTYPAARHSYFLDRKRHALTGVADIVCVL